MRVVQYVPTFLDSVSVPSPLYLIRPPPPCFYLVLLLGRDSRPEAPCAIRPGQPGGGGDPPILGRWRRGGGSPKPATKSKNQFYPPPLPPSDGHETSYK